MAIYRKMVTRSSRATIAIEADNKEEADLIYGDWLDEGNDENYEELSQMLNERSLDTDEWLTGFPNAELYNRASVMDDFVIIKGDTKKDDSEPMYDLYLTYVDHNDSPICYGKNKKMADIITDLKMLDELYYIKKLSDTPSWDAYVSAKERKANILNFRLERRKNGCQK